MPHPIKLTCAALLGLRLLNAQAVVSQQDIEAWKTVWQQKLHLQRWKISIRTASRKQLGPFILGDVRFSFPHQAVIRILDGTHPYFPARMLRRSSELTVVHELIHVAVRPLQPNNADKRTDAVVEDIAEALLFGRVPTCVTPRNFMEVEISSLPGTPIAARSKEQVVQQLTAAFLDGRRSWTQQHAATCAAVIRKFFARSAWR